MTIYRDPEGSSHCAETTLFCDNGRFLKSSETLKSSRDDFNV